MLEVEHNLNESLQRFQKDLVYVEHQMAQDQEKQSKSAAKGANRQAGEKDMPKDEYGPYIPHVSSIPSMKDMVNTENRALIKKSHGARSASQSGSSV